MKAKAPVKEPETSVIKQRCHWMDTLQLRSSGLRTAENKILRIPRAKPLPAHHLGSVCFEAKWLVGKRFLVTSGPSKSWGCICASATIAAYTLRSKTLHLRRKLGDGNFKGGLSWHASCGPNPNIVLKNLIPLKQKCLLTCRRQKNHSLKSWSVKNDVATSAKPQQSNDNGELPSPSPAPQ